MAPKKTDDDASLKRLGGGRWQTRDERFTIEPQSGTWVLVDAEQTDDLGLPLVRGPFRSLTDAKAAVQAARGTAAPESPLAGRVSEAGTRLSGSRSATEQVSASAVKAERGAPGGSAADVTAAPPPKAPSAKRAPQPPPEPRWLAELSPRDRGRARRLIERLTEAGVRDAEGHVRQDVTGGVPTVARVAIADRLAALLRAGDEPQIGDRALGPLIEALDHGRDDDLDVRWRLVDGGDRPIGLTADDLRAALKRGPMNKGSDR
jgi:hypothetical protein